LLRGAAGWQLELDLALSGDVEGARTCFQNGLDIAEKLPKQDGSFNRAVVIDELRRSEKKLVRLDPRR
jgi:hypothetical protein